MSKRKATPTKSNAMATASAGVVMLKVALQGNPEIWRRIALRGDQTLEALHEAIYNAFDRYDEHLYLFYFPRPGSRGLARWRDGIEYVCAYMCEEPDPFIDKPRLCAAETTISSLKLKRGQKLAYLFDFGDSWWHDITVEETNAAADDGKYPRILEVNGKSPPQYPDFDE